MDKMVARWDGWGGGPGFSNFYFSGENTGAELDDKLDAIHDFFAGVSGDLPNAITITFQPTVVRINEATGDQTDEVSIPTVPGPVTGLGGPNFSSPSGACVSWLTGVTVGSRKLKGRTFLVPLASIAYGPDGSLNDTILTEIRTAAAIFVQRCNTGGDSKLVVWHRPVGGAGGQAVQCVSSVVADRAAMLTSRRQ